MEITFCLTEQDIFRYRCYLLTHDYGYSVRQFVPILLVVFFLWFNHYQESLLFRLFSVLVVTPLALGLYLLVMRAQVHQELRSSPGVFGQKTVTLGKYDLRWASPNGHYYFHWTNFSVLVDQGDYIYLLLSKRKALIIPKRAFEAAAQTQRFLMISLDRWQRAKVNEAGGIGHDAWPPPPELGG
ncbi:MAG: YcxB family protein [Armatimonadota bacterium]|nr:YcxB family protein [Armatimonadota bacterium]